MITDYDGKRLTPKEAAVEMLCAMGYQCNASSLDELADAACINRPEGADIQRVVQWLDRGRLKVRFLRHHVKIK